MRTSALFGAKKQRNLWCVRTDKRRGEVELVRIFFGQGGEVGQFFAIFCEHPLWTAPIKLLFFYCFKFFLMFYIAAYVVVIRGGRIHVLTDLGALPNSKRTDPGPIQKEQVFNLLNPDSGSAICVLVL